MISIYRGWYKSEWIDREFKTIKLFTTLSKLLICYPIFIFFSTTNHEMNEKTIDVKMFLFNIQFSECFRFGSTKNVGDFKKKDREFSSEFSLRQSVKNKTKVLL